MHRGARGVGLALALVALVAGACANAKGNPTVVIGVSTTAATAAEGATIVVPPPAPASPAELRARAEEADSGPLIDFSSRPRPQSPPAPGLKQADGRPYGEPILFRSSAPVPSELFFVIVVGSDARPGEDVRRANGDAVQLIAVNPRSGQGTIVGIPRDSWVEVPGRGHQKLSTVLHSGPETEAATIRHLTGLPTKYYVLTGFNGLPRLVDDLGGVNVYVERRMNDKFSGARFEPGWHHFNGRDALAFSRNRYDTPYGDFSRSGNQAKLILAALSKLRAEVGDEDALRRWINVLMRDVHLNLPLSEVQRLGTVAARLDPKQVRTTVVPGRAGSANGQAVVFLGAEAAAIFNDLRDDAVLGRAGPATTTTTETTTTTTTTTSTTVPSVLGGSSTTSSTSTTNTTEPGDAPDR